MSEMIETKHYKYVVLDDRVDLWHKDKNHETEPPFIKQPFTKWEDISEWFVNHIAFLDKCIDEAAE
jgi:hypothetical protein